MIVPQFSPDLVLVLDKQAAINQANYNLQAYNVRKRLDGSLQREEALRQLWRATEKQNQDYMMLTINMDTQIKNLEQQLEVRSEEKEAMIKVYKKGKRKSFIRGAGIGIGVGLIGALILTSR